MIREFVMKAKAKEAETVSTEIDKREVTHASRARIRYVGGYCVAKVRLKYVIKTPPIDTQINRKKKDDYDNAKDAVEILNRLKQDKKTVLENTEEPC